ncbi:uncharacterized protein I206_103798 [Kwoniella pini CBS 10737]|uniref:Uncharacterized protein n=1 Tax=Kwoniella pini CBS 10737 TaxID=1296096 RepID=A0A1B9HSL7_9TREE|nr:uncharacterized protein I206_07747 [Kwoniella pini CBS 10737]OCF46270.1 hypothetical protein I206_07747 [Kwoniella pini CBS 10737]
MTYKRLLTSLASHSPSSSTASNARLIPPYAQSLPSTSQTPASSLRPPYTNSVPLGVEARSSRSLKSSKHFELILGNEKSDKTNPGKWNQWRRDVLSNDQSRREIESRFREVIFNLEKLRGGQIEVPQIPFQQLGSNLSSPSTVDGIKSTGLVIVRDVVRDSEAIEWAKEILLSMGERNGKAVYWHPALLNARSNPSILWANSQLSSALLGSSEVYLTASSIIEGLHPSPTVPTNSNPWNSPQSLLSHLALTPSIPTSSIIVSPTIYSAEYASLRPLFKSVKSKISFYSKEGYLNSENWILNDSLLNTETEGKDEKEMDLPHLKEIQIVNPEIRPGDMIFNNSSLPISTSKNSGQIFLPLNPLIKNDLKNKKLIEEQKLSFENGLPPPSSIEFHSKKEKNLLWQVEEKGNKNLISSRSGRDVMGY